MRPNLAWSGIPSRACPHSREVVLRISARPPNSQYGVRVLGKGRAEQASLTTSIVARPWRALLTPKIAPGVGPKSSNGGPVAL